MRKISRKSSLLSCAALLLTASSVAFATPVTYTLDSQNSIISTVNLDSARLGRSELNNPSTLTIGNYNYNYAAVYFNPSENAKYFFGQTSSLVDTVMILYNGIFNPLNPGLNAIVGNDDTSYDNHAIYFPYASISCGDNIDYCPQVSANLTANSTITLIISTYQSGAALSFPTSFYSNLSGTFGATVEEAGGGTVSPVNSNINVSDLPEEFYLNGGAIRFDDDLGTNLPVSDAGGTLDTDGEAYDLTGGLSDYTGATGTGDLQITGGGSLSITGPNDYTGTLTVTDDTTLIVAGTPSLGSGGLTLDNGTLQTSAPLSTSAPVTLAPDSSNTIDTDGNLTNLGGGLTGSGDVTLTGGNTLILGGDGANFSGDLTLTGGTTLSVAGADALGSGDLTLSGGTLQTTAALTTDNAIGLATGTSNVINTGNFLTNLGGGVSGSGALIFTGGNTLTLGGNGANFSGDLTLTGGTTLSVAGANPLGSGDITLSGGTLQTTAAFTTETTLGLSTGSSNVINTGNFLTNLGGGLSGSGALTFTGGNTLTLGGDGANFSGDLTLTGGTTLSVAGANPLGSGDITLSGGTLQTRAAFTTETTLGLAAGSSNVINTGNFLTNLGGGVSGSGALTFTGGNTLTLGGNGENFSGDLTLTGGTTLSVAGADALGSGDLTLSGGALQTTAALTTETTLGLSAGSSNVINTGNFLTTLGNGLSGSGSLTITGGNTLRMGGASDGFTGNLIVTGGTTLVVGSPSREGTMSLCGLTIVENYSTISGNGVVCSVDVNETGRISPGNSPGTLTIVGDLNLNAGSNFDQEIDGTTYSEAGGAGSYDRTVVTGILTVNGNLNVITRGISGNANNNFTAQIGDVFSIVEASNVSGRFSSVTQPTEGLAQNTRYDVRYTANSVQIVVTPGSFAALIGNTDGVQNARNAAAGLDEVRPDATGVTGDLASVFAGLYGLDTASYTRSLHQLSGEIYAQSLHVSIENAQTALNTVHEAAGTGFGSFAATPLRANKAKGRVWGQYLRYETDHATDGVSGTYKSRKNGYVMGVTLAGNSSLSAGIAGSYAESEVLNPLGSSARINSGAGYLYASFNPSEAFEITGVAGGAVNDMRVKRSISTVGDSVTASSTRQHLSLMASLNARYRLLQSDSFALWGTADADYIRTTKGAVQEQASDEAYALRINGKAPQFSEARIGGKAQYTNGAVQLAASANLINQLGRQLEVVRTAQMGDANWQTSSARMDRTGFSYGASARATLAKHLSAQVSYEHADRGQSFKSDRVAAGLSLAF